MENIISFHFSIIIILGFESYLVEAKDNFNIRSRVATNPKEITELTVIDDKTIRIIFRSQEVLNLSQISRSLRVFSMYLIDETHPLNFSASAEISVLFSRMINQAERHLNFAIGLSYNSSRETLLWL